MPSARVIPFREQDPRLAEEARSAARIVQGIRNGDSAAESKMVERYSRFTIIAKAPSRSSVDVSMAIMTRLVQ